MRSIFSNLLLLLPLFPLLIRALVNPSIVDSRGVKIHRPGPKIPPPHFLDTPAVQPEVPDTQ